MTYLERTHNIKTNEITERFFTEEEIVEIETRKAKVEAQIQAQAEAAAAKAALLERLGITEEEAKLLLS